MEPIKNLKKGSILSVYIYDGINKTVVEHEAKVTPRDDLMIHNLGRRQWKEVGADPREAINLYVKKVERQMERLKTEIRECQLLLCQKYPVHPVLSEEDFKKRYPYLYPSMRTEDHNPAMLDRWNIEKESMDRWGDRYNEPG